MGRVACQEGHPRRKTTLLQKTMMTENNIVAPSPWQPFNGQGVPRIPRLNRRAHESRAGGVVYVCTVNVGTLVGRRREVVDMLSRRRVDIGCVQEVRYKNEGATTVGTGTDKYKFWYCGGPAGENGVGIFVKFDLVESVIEVVRFGDRLMKIKIVLGGVVYHVFSAYAPQVGRTLQEKEEFWENFEDLIIQIPDRDGIIIGGDLNGHIGTDRNDYEDVMGYFGYGNRNDEGITILDMCKNQSLKILNTLFKKDREKYITYKSGGAETQLDLVIVKRMRGLCVLDCKAIPGEACLTQHRLVRADLKIMNFKKKKWRGIKKLKTWKLKCKETRDDFEEKLDNRLRQSEMSWTNFEKSILETAEEVCGRTSGRRGQERETWWWNDEVKEHIKEKRTAFKNWQRYRTEETRRLYKIKSRETRRAVAIAKRQAWEEWSRDLGGADGRNKMFRIAKQMQKDRKDIQGTNYIKDSNNNIKIDEHEVAERWRVYFEGLLNGGYNCNLEDVEVVEGPIEEVTRAEIVFALKAMKDGKASGPSGVSSELLKGAGETGVQAMLSIFNEIIRSGSVPVEWRESLTIPLYKGKGDALQCNKYRGLRLLEHAMKVWERILNERLKKIVKIGDCQCGFVEGKGTTDAIFMMRQMQELYGEKNRRLYHIFVDLEKAFDKVPRQAIAWALRRQKVPESLVGLVMALYVESKTRVRVAGVVSELLDIGVGVHQGSTLSPLLFNVVLEEVTREDGRGVPWELLYADDLVLTAESGEEVEQMFNRWKRNLEHRGFRVNMEKTKIMVTGKRTQENIRSGRYPCGVCGRGVGVNSVLCTGCDRWCHGRCSGLRNLGGVMNFLCPTCVRGGNVEEADESLEIDGARIEEVGEFCYLGDMLDRSGGSERSARTRVAAAWTKWREIASLLINRGIPLEKRAQVYEACIRSVLLYGTETWPLTGRIERILVSCDRKMLRYMAGVTWRDQVSSEEVASRCDLLELHSLLTRRRLRWFGHVERRDVDEALGVVRTMEVEGRRLPGRPKKTWRKNMQDDMRSMGLRVEDAMDRSTWRGIINRLTS